MASKPITLGTLGPIRKVTRPAGVARGVFDDDDDDDDTPAAAAAAASTPSAKAELDEDAKRLIAKTAEWTAKKGQTFEDYTRNANLDNPKFKFLTDPTSADAAYYRDQLARQKFVPAALEALQSAPPAMTAPSYPTPAMTAPSYPTPAMTAPSYPTPNMTAPSYPTPAMTAPSYPTPNMTTPPPKPPMPFQSLPPTPIARFGPPPQVPQPTPFAAPAQQQNMVAEALARAHAVAQQLRTSSSPATAAPAVAITPLVDAASKKRRWDEHAVDSTSSPVVAKMPATQQTGSAAASPVPLPGMVKVGKVWMYPEDEDASQGTWEHRKRAQEMRETAERASLLTTAAQQGRAHHISDYLPKDELEKFIRKAQAARTGQTLVEEDFAQNKLDSSNVGFQMLKNAGWQEGQGLGSNADGIVAPVNLAEMGPERSGLGQEKPDAPEQDDNEFDSYRKRMMVAYKFRPNPLNNPRRQYY